MLQLMGISKVPLIKPGDDLPKIIVHALNEESLTLDNGDILVIAQSIISKSENRIVDLNSIVPSEQARDYAQMVEKDLRVIELILKESSKVLKYNTKAMIVELFNGMVCANAGIDQSNSGGQNHVTLLPLDSDHSARTLQEKLEELTGKHVAIIITDTQGRPFRKGAINIGIGIAGFKDPILNYKGKVDLYGYKLQTTEINIIDELASAAELIMGESDEGFPIVLIRGFKFQRGTAKSDELIRSKKDDLFRDD